MKVRYLDRPSFPQAEWRELASAMSERFLATLDLESVPPLPETVAPFLRLSKGFSLHRTAAGVPEMSRLVETLAVYGETERAGRAVAEFRVLPYGTHRFPEPSSWQIGIQTVWFFARRNGDAARVKLLEPLLELFPRSELPPAYLKARGLHNPLDDPPEITDARSARYFASDLLMQIARLASLSVYGGSWAYPRRRVDAEIERHLDALFAVPGCAPLR